jgi:hypothetical protein
MKVEHLCECCHCYVKEELIPSDNCEKYVCISCAHETYCFEAGTYYFCCTCKNVPCIKREK